jgi:hypothetical protein
MSTRGMYAIRKNGEDKGTYNHSDSYPSGLGMDVVSFCKRHTSEELSRLFDNIILIDEKIKPTKEQIEICKKNGYADFSVLMQSEEDWYCLLRHLQGNFDNYDECINDNKQIFMKDNVSFITDSLFCEFAYIINLDDNVLEFYQGFQRIPQKGNRYGTSADDSGYYPCRLCLIIPFTSIYNSSVESIVEKMEVCSESADAIGLESLNNNINISEAKLEEIMTKLKDIGLFTDEIGECIRNDKTNVINVFDDFVDLGEKSIVCTDEMKPYINYEKYGQDLVSKHSYYLALSSGRIVEVKEEE